MEMIELLCHSCKSRNLKFIEEWIPVFTGMTKRKVEHLTKDPEINSG
jgi:hypothetical protein